MSETGTNTLDTVRKIFQETLHTPANLIEPETSMNDIPQWSSLSHIFMIDRVESEFGVSFSPRDIERAITIDMIIKLIEEKKQNTK